MTPSPVYTLAMVASGSSLAATTYSNWCLVDGCSIISVQSTWTGTPTGVFTLQACDTWPIAPTGGFIADSGLTIYDLGATFAAIPSGSASSGDDQFSNVAAKWVRLKYTASSGTGTYSGRLTAKKA